MLNIKLEFNDNDFIKDIIASDNSVTVKIDPSFFFMVHNMAGWDGSSSHSGLTFTIWKKVDESDITITNILIYGVNSTLYQHTKIIDNTTIITSYNLETNDD
jgi:hypothetical protein